MKTLFCIFFVLGVSWNDFTGACTIPSGLIGTWTSSSKGSLTFTSSSLSGYTVSNFGALDFNCTDTSGSKLIFKSSSFAYLGLEWEAYICMDVTAVSAYLYTYYLGSVIETDARNERVKIFVKGVNPSASSVCDRTGAYETGTYDILLKNVSSAKISCPSSLQAFWSYTIDSGSGKDCVNDSSLDVCTDNATFSFNYTRCSTNVAYSVDGTLSCIYESTNGTSSYLTLYNHDNNTDESSTYRFTCLVYEVTSNGTYMTQYPQACLSNQTTQSVISPGASILLYNKQACPTTTISFASATASWVYAVVVLLVLILLIFVGIGVWKAWKKYGQSKDELRGIKVDKEPLADEIDGPSPEGEDLPQNVLTLLEKENSLPTEGIDKGDSIQITVASPMPTTREEETPGPHPGEIPGSIVDYHTVGVVKHPSSPKPTKNVRMSPKNPRGGIVPRSSPLGNKPSPRTPRTPRGGNNKSVVPSKSIVSKNPPVKPSGPATAEMARGRRLPPISENSGGSKLQRSQTTKSGKWKPKQKVAVAPTPVERRNSLSSVNSRDSVDSSPGGRPKSRSVSFRQDVEAKKRAKRLKSQGSRDPGMEEDENYLPPNIAPIKITRVDIPALTSRASESELKIQEIDNISPNNTKQLVWSTGQEVEDPVSSVRIKKVWLEPEDPTEEIWAKVSSLWRIGQTWMDKTVNI